MIYQFSIMYTVHFDGFNTAVCSYSFAISQHILKKNLILNTKSINRLFEEKMLLAKELCGKLYPRTEKILLAPRVDFFLVSTIYFEIRRRKKKRAMERFAIKRMRRKLRSGPSA